MRRAFLPLLVVLVSFAGFPAFAAATLTKTSIQLNWMFQFEFAGPIAALEKGFYREAGLEVELRQGGPKVDPIAPVADGSVDFGIAGSSLVVERHNGKPVVALASLMQHSAVGLLARRSAGIGSVFDLKGKRLAITFDTAAENDAYLKSQGITPTDYQRIDHFVPVAGLDAGEADAIAVYVSNELFHIRNRVDDYILFTPRSSGIDLFGNILFTNEKLLAQRPELVEAFRKATIRGWDYALKHPQEVADLLLASYNSQDKTREHLLFEAEKLWDLTRPDIVEPGYMSPGRWRHVAEVYAEQGKLPRDPDLRGFIYDPSPKVDLTWFYLGLLGSLLALLIVVGIAVYFRRMSQRLLVAIAERKRTENALRDSEANYRELVDNVNAIILRMAPDGTITYFNEYAEHFFGYRAAEILGRHVIGTIVPAVESQSERDLSEMIAHILAEPERYADNENENMTRDGRRVFIRWANQVILDGNREPSGVLSIGTDITAQKQAEALLIKSKEAAESANQAKSRFLATMSHEIRTPMNGILGMAQLMLMEDELTNEQRKDYTRTILNSGQTLLTLLNDILDLSRVEAGKLELSNTAFYPGQLVEEATHLFARSAAAKGLRIEAAWQGPADRHYEADATRLRQMLSNLIGNAIKFTPQGFIRIEARGVEEDARQAVLEFAVIDSGIGVLPETQTRLFHPFTQADSSTTREHGGSGLGLSIVRSIAQLMGGTAGMTSEPGKGSRFWFRVRVRPLDEGRERRHADRGADTAGRPQETLAGKVLVVEDNATNRKVTEVMLRKLGLESVCVENGLEAVEALRNGLCPDLVLMDVQMPVMDGITATGHIRAREQETGRAHLPIVALTAGAFEEDSRRCRAAGMDDFLTKPIKIEDLGQVVSKWLGAR